MRDDFAETVIHLARHGQHYGPLSDTQMRNFNELGHLLRTDLVWRKGFPDWQAAGAVFEIARREKG